MTLPDTRTLMLNEEHSILHVTLNRPECRNAMSQEMVNELMAVFDYVEHGNTVRALVLRGANGHFCAGGDIKDMSTARQQAAQGDTRAYATFNRLFGTLITRANQLPCVVIAVLEGAVLGGGFGLACISDVAIATEQATFGLPETGLGVIPAQIAPFVVQRIGTTQARRLALTGLRIQGQEAKQLGIVHQCVSDDQLESALHTVLSQVRRCAPLANRVTKQLVLSTTETDLDTLLDQAAEDFSNAVTGEEGTEGTLAFVQKRPPAWAAD